MSWHPSNDQLKRWLDGGLPEAEAASITVHVDQCSDTCQIALDRINVFEQPRQISVERDVPACPPNYRFINLIGRGGMGTVIRAHDPLFNRDVAIKYLTPGNLPGQTNHHNHMWRFRLEGSSMARLNHSNVVPVYQVEIVDGRPFLVMEYAEGGSLESRGSGGNNPVEVAALMEKVAGAVHYAHSRGVVHRDIKPSNILLSLPRASAGLDGQNPSVMFRGQYWTPKLGDFGLVKIVDNLGPPVEVTQENEAMGSPAFMAPERLPGGDGRVGAPTDVHGLGVTLYWLLTGRPPFEAATKTEVLRLVRTSLPPPVRSVRSEVPAELEAICMKCLQTRPEDRYTNAGAVADELRQFLNRASDGSGTTRPAGQAGEVRESQPTVSADPTTGVRIEAIEGAAPVSDPGPTPPVQQATAPIGPVRSDVYAVSPPDRDRIVVLGRRMSGKTIYLANLYAKLWKGDSSLTAKALSGEVHKYLMDQHAEMKAGRWPAATAAGSRLELELEYHGEKHLMVSMDFAGEVFARTFLHDKADDPIAKELISHVDRAAAVLLLVDPSVGFGTDNQAAMEDDFGLVQAVQRIRNWPGGSAVPIVVVLTKMDQYKKLADQAGGATELVRRQFPALVRTLGQVVIFQVSAVQVARSDDGKLAPLPTAIPVNLENPIKHCLRQIAAAKAAAVSAEIEMNEQLTATAALHRERRQNLAVIIFIALILIAGGLVACWLILRGHSPS